MNQSDQDQNIPVPDPTTLTTEQLHRELGHLEQLVQTRIDALVEADRQKEVLRREFLESRLAAMEHARENQHAAIRELFQTILTAQKEAVDKAEKSISNQLKSLEHVIDTKDQTREVQIREVEKRVDRDEGKSKGISQSWAIAVAIITIVVAIAAVVASANLSAAPVVVNGS